ncbi:MAG: DUF2505 domain-containing protein [Actinomycetota bacterium]|jgi:hypothetical protein|nr:DUF2505 domain-containing protein [Actinomycetota bacterium]
MALRFEYAFPAGVDEVHAVLTDPGFLREYADATHSRDVEVDAAPDGSSTSVRRVMPTDAVPSFAKPFLGDEVPVEETVAWRPSDGDGSRYGDLAVDASAASRQARLRGTMRLLPEGPGCRLVAEGDVSVKVPLVGGKLAPLVEQLLQSAVRKQCELADRRLGA